MKIISHRGYWKSQEEKNTVVAFERSFGLGFGTETDLRDLNGALVISHDMPCKGALEFRAFLDLCATDLPLALNIKSDGLAAPLGQAMSEFGSADWFVFDMSVPDMMAHLRVGNPVFTRMSEFERFPILLDKCDGVWLDSFTEEWFDVNLLIELTASGKRVCIVSPELHNRERACLWEKIRPMAENKNVLLCTDTPEIAQQFFFGSGK